MGEHSSETMILAMAVADGVASPAEQKAFEAAVGRDPSLVALLDGFRRTGRPLARAFDDMMDRPVPEAMRAAIADFGTAAGGRQPLAFVATARSRWRDMFSSWEVPGLVLAASALAFACGNLLVPSLSSRPIASGGAELAMAAPQPARALSQALSLVGTGPERPVAGQGGDVGVLRVIETFKDQAGAPCREYEAQLTTGPRQYGVACFEAGAWRLRALFEGPRQTDGIKTAGPGDLGDMLDQLAGTMRAGDALGADEEKALIASGWGGKP